MEVASEEDVIHGDCNWHLSVSHYFFFFFKTQKNYFMLESPVSETVKFSIFVACHLFFQIYHQLSLKRCHDSTETRAVKHTGLFKSQPSSRASFMKLSSC